MKNYTLAAAKKMIPLLAPIFKDVRSRQDRLTSNWLLQRRACWDGDSDDADAIEDSMEESRDELKGLGGEVAELGCEWDAEFLNLLIPTSNAGGKCWFVFDGDTIIGWQDGRTPDDTRELSTWVEVNA